MFIAVKPDESPRCCAISPRSTTPGTSSGGGHAGRGAAAVAVRDCAAGRIIDHPGHAQYPMLVNEAMSAVSPGRYVSDEQLEEVLSPARCGRQGHGRSEKLMDAVTAVSGSGPAYAFLLAEAMIDAGVGLGLTRVQASELAVQTIRGAGILLSESGLSPVDLRAAVTSPAEPPPRRSASSKRPGSGTVSTRRCGLCRCQRKRWPSSRR